MNINGIEEKLIEYIKKNVSKLKKDGDNVKLENVNPYLIEKAIGDFDDGYDLNGYDCDYWANIGQYSIFGCMRYGTATISLKSKSNDDIEEDTCKILNRNNQNENKTKDDLGYKIVEMNEINEINEMKEKGLSEFYFSFGGGQIHENCYQLIMAENSKIAHHTMHKVHGTHWCSCYTAEEWKEEFSEWMSILRPLKPIIVE